MRFCCNIRRRSSVYRVPNCPTRAWSAARSLARRPVRSDREHLPWSSLLTDDICRLQPPRQMRETTPPLLLRVDTLRGGNEARCLASRDT